MAYTDSKTWISNIAREFDRFLNARNSNAHIASSSPSAPHPYREWVAYHLFVKEGAQEAESRQPERKEPQPSEEDKQTLKPTFAGKSFTDHRSPVLAMETIWLPSTEFHPAKPVAPWPCNDELNSEGTLRGLSGYSRFLPLPRVPSNETVYWRKRALITPYPFDTFGKPSLQRTEEAETDTAMSFLVGEAVLREIDG
ncbi:uncharacterized protein ACLA_049830 [Aspergillus clavatus NRRL 1]|uniref:Uncharacterized protein n=1 Tax=Aspergillus clavatus (strain ATCC 1007 / CBS 513.65 / DSM 816 / NCTC 3887 / NRRL 1 / QM 1276 / 107) TaxID=344612 RepID=A1CI06_ASPCL|nr:uncharacterized protein ACLA_049830 [Aspergillus clavatus NRRL 1]EAW10511.1 conserved hypothetical protein [Aspergillus clavatus NRRL 1]